MNSEFLHNYPVWDRLFELLYPCDDDLTDEQVDAELARLGIDMKPAFQRLHKMIETQRARAQLLAANEKRATIGERIREIVSAPLEDVRRQIKDVVGRMKGDEVQLAYFHKLETAASEQDLQSLLDDLEKLEVFKELRNDAQGK